MIAERLVRYRPPAAHRVLSARIRESLDPGVIARAEQELSLLVEQCLDAIARHPDVPPRRDVEAAVRPSGI